MGFGLSSQMGSLSSVQYTTYHIDQCRFQMDGGLGWLGHQRRTWEVQLLETYAAWRQSKQRGSVHHHQILEQVSAWRAPSVNILLYNSCLCWCICTRTDFLNMCLQAAAEEIVIQIYFNIDSCEFFLIKIFVF